MTRGIGSFDREDIARCMQLRFCTAIPYLESRNEVMDPGPQL